jgi:hypothetical protein
MEYGRASHAECNHRESDRDTTGDKGERGTDRVAESGAWNLLHAGRRAGRRLRLPPLVLCDTSLPVGCLLDLLAT